MGPTPPAIRACPSAWDTPAPFAKAAFLFHLKPHDLPLITPLAQPIPMEHSAESSSRSGTCFLPKSCLLSFKVPGLGLSCPNQKAAALLSDAGPCSLHKSSSPPCFAFSRCSQQCITQNNGNFKKIWNLFRLQLTLNIGSVSKIPSSAKVDVWENG